MSGLPSSWVGVELGDLFDITSSKRVHQHEWTEEGVPFYRAREIKKLARFGSVENELYISEKLFEKYASEFGAPIPGDLMVTAVGTLGECYLVKEGDRFYFKDASVLWFRKNTIVESLYILRMFLSKSVQEQIHKGGGTTVGTYTVGAAKKTIIPLPPLAEQKRIVAKLDALNAKSARARAELTRIETLVIRYKQAVLRMAFSGELTVEWQQVQGLKSWMNAKPEDLFKWSSGKNLPSRNYMKGTVPVIGGNGVSGYHDSSNVETPTIVIGRVGAQCGNVYHSLGPAWITDNAIYAKWISPEVDLRFAVLVYEKADLNKLSGGTGQPYVNHSTLNSIDFPLPSREEQLEIVRRIESAFASIDRLAAEAKHALKLMDKLDEAVLAEAFRGELVQQDENDEPASVLLERIRAERETAPKAKRGRKKQ